MASAMRNKWHENAHPYLKGREWRGDKRKKAIVLFEVVLTVYIKRTIEEKEKTTKN
jgi:hypothetical protein